MENIKPELMFTEQRTLFVRGLSENTTQETLRSYFSQYGEVTNIIVKTGRGYGFITFADSLNVDNIHQNGPHVLEGRRIHPKRYVPRSMPKKKSDNFGRLFLGGLPSNVTETYLREFFSRYGEIMDVEIMRDQMSKSRGFGFLEFEDEEAAERCYSDRFVNLNGKQVEIRRATTRTKNNLAAFVATPLMSVEGIGVGRPNEPFIARMAPGYQGWSSSSATGYGYTAPTDPSGYQIWDVPARSQCSSTYRAAQQSAYGSYGITNLNFKTPQATPRARYGNGCNCSMSQNVPVTGKTTSPELRRSFSETSEHCPSTSLVSGDEDNIIVENDSDGEETNEDVKKTDEGQKRKERRRKSITLTKSECQKKQPEEDEVEIAKETPEIEESNCFPDANESEKDLHSLIEVLKNKTASFDTSSERSEVNDFIDEFVKAITASCKNLEPLFRFTEDELYAMGITLGVHRRLIFIARDRIRQRSMALSDAKSEVIKMLSQHIKKMSGGLNSLENLIERLYNKTEMLRIARETSTKIFFPADAGTKN